MNGCGNSIPKWWGSSDSTRFGWLGLPILGSELRDAVRFTGQNPINASKMAAWIDQVGYVQPRANKGTPMAELVADCPRCGASSMTFNVTGEHRTDRVEYGWKQFYEVFAICRRCNHATIFLLSNNSDSNYDRVNRKGLLNMDRALNCDMDIEGAISIRDQARVVPPKHLPHNIANAFNEGATCLVVECWNAAATMFRLCLDQATGPLLPQKEDGKPEPKGLNGVVRRSLGLRLQWLFDNGLLPEVLRELSQCVKDDGNDGAHAGTLTKEDAEDLLDFAEVLLERLYTEPERLAKAAERRKKRREREAPK